MGTVFVFKLEVPELGETLSLRGEVRWVVRPGSPRPPGIAEGHDTGMGIRFIYDRPDERENLERRVEKLMIDRLGQLIYSRLLAENAVTR